MDINVHKKFSVPVRERVCRLTNIHPTFCRYFILLHDEARNIYLIQDDTHRTVFAGSFEGVPRYAACVDIDDDRDPDVLVQVAAYGNHGNGSERFEVLLNKQGQLSPLKDPIQFEFYHGQENKAGLLTWHAARGFCAVFVGEEAEVTGHGTDLDPIQIGPIKKVKEVWAHQDGRMRLISKASTPLERDAVQYLTFR